MLKSSKTVSIVDTKNVKMTDQWYLLYNYANTFLLCRGTACIKYTFLHRKENLNWRNGDCMPFLPLKMTAPLIVWPLSGFSSLVASRCRDQYKGWDALDRINNNKYY